MGKSQYFDWTLENRLGERFLEREKHEEWQGPLLHQSFLSFFLSFSLCLFVADSLERGNWLHNPGTISLFPSFTLSSSTPDHQVPVH